MRFLSIAETDVGIAKATNQDSLLIKHAYYKESEILMAIICDGMGGLSHGELASATVIRRFSDWFEKNLAAELKNLDMTIVGHKWAAILKNLNIRIAEYGRKIGESLGTTFTGILMIDDEYVIVHVGDTRAYSIDSRITQLTKDQTFIAAEVAKGTLTAEQAKTDKRRNILLQCVGASRVVEPDIITGKVKKGVYLLCSDGFRHEISDREIYDYMNPAQLTDAAKMKSNARYLIETVKSRNEKDNISVIAIKAE